MNKEELISYAFSFVSFISKDLKHVNEIVLFGSVARGEFNKNSDVDLFFDVNKENIKKVEIAKILSKFYKSSIYHAWELKGIKNKISVKIGSLETWKLKRSIISDGIVLYGKYKESSKDLKHYILIVYKPIKDIAKRNKITRKFIGRIEKNYSNKGILENLKGKFLSERTIIIPLENSKEVLDILNKEKIDYKFFEIWSDQFHG